MEDSKAAKGVFDILPEVPENEEKWKESFLWQYVETIAKKTAEEFGFKEIRTPIFEKTSLFQRSIGQGSDIVSKEMYTFLDKAGRSLSLRPEGTAPVMRAIIEKNLYNSTTSHKFYYLFSMFRYERQQAGRYRQHHQFGVEVIGKASPYQDAEVIDLLYTFLHRLGIHGTTLKINSIGNKECRQAYKQALKNYLAPFFNELSDDSKIRFEINPLRILDSKNPHDKKLLKEAPNILEFLDEESKRDFNTLNEILRELEITYVIDPHLVRGLDYYNKTVFEITSEELGAQNSLGGGGRYDDLLKELGGPDLPAFGFGAGLERIIQTMLAQQVFLPEAPHPVLYVIPLDEKAKNFGFKLVHDLRKKHIHADIDLSEKKLKNAMRLASNLKARFVLVLGEEEMRTQKGELKTMESGKIQKISLDEIDKWL